MRVEPGVSAAFGIASLPVTSHRDEEWAGDTEASSDLTREVVPVDHGQPDVEQGNLGMDVVQSVQCRDAVMKDDHVVTRVLEQVPHRDSQVIVVVDDRSSQSPIWSSNVGAL